jgi:hypothetical protein
MEKEAARMEKLWGKGLPEPGMSSSGWASQARPDLAELVPAGQVRHPFDSAQGTLLHVSRGDYAVFFSTSAEFFDPNPTQLQIACSIRALRPISGT